MPGTTGALVRGQDVAGVYLAIEPGEEGGSAGPGRRAALRVQGMGSSAGAECPFGGEKAKTAPPSVPVSRECEAGR